MKATVPIRILIVEDNPDDETVLLRQLKKAQLNAHVRVITDGKRAIHYLTDARQKCEDLVAVFINLHLPPVGGIKLLETIRSEERLKHVPVIVMASTLEHEDLEKCRQLGVSSYVNKPVSFSAFVKAVADTFHTRKAARNSGGIMATTE